MNDNATIDINVIKIVLVIMIVSFSIALSAIISQLKSTNRLLEMVVETNTEQLEALKDE